MAASGGGAAGACDAPRRACNQFQLHAFMDIRTFNHIPRGRRASGIYWRPKLLWKQKNRRYVLWYERGARHGAPAHGAYGVAVASSPAGPFKIINPDVHLKWSYLTAGDSSLMQLPNGNAYIICKSNITSVELLSADYLSSTYQNSEDIAPRAATEALALFFFVSIGCTLHVSSPS